MEIKNLPFRVIPKTQGDNVDLIPVRKPQPAAVALVYDLVDLALRGDLPLTSAHFVSSFHEFPALRHGKLITPLVFRVTGVPFYPDKLHLVPVQQVEQRFP